MSEITFRNPAITRINTPIFRVNNALGLTKKIWTTKADWDGGVLDEVETDSSPGDVKLSLNTFDYYYTLSTLPETDNVVSYWKFEDSSGSILDETDNNHDGTYNGALYQQSGKVDYSLGFDGDNDVVIVPNSSDFDFADQDWSISFWINPDDQTAASPPWVFQTIDNGYGITVAVQNAAVVQRQMVVYIGDSTASGWAYYSPNGTILPKDTWSHVVITFDRSAQLVKVYLDGEVIDSDSKTDDTPTATGVWIGNRITGGSDRGFKGELDELVMWKGVALSQEDVTKLYVGALTGNIRLKYDSSIDNNVWQKYLFTATEFSGVNVKIRCRTASSESGLASASWGSWIENLTGDLNCDNNRWIEMEAYLETDDITKTPTLHSLIISDGEIITYELQISTVENFATTVLNKTDIAESFENDYTEYQVIAGDLSTALASGTKYYYRWRVKYPDPVEYGKWSVISSFYYDTSLYFDPDNDYTEYAPEMWSLVSITDGEDRYEIEKYPYPYMITPIKQENRTRNLIGTLLVAHIATKYEIELNFDILGQNGYNELLRFFLNHASFYLISYIDGCRNIWKVRPEEKFRLQLVSNGNQDSFKGPIIFEEV